MFIKHVCLALVIHLLFLFIFLSILLDTLTVGLSRPVSCCLCVSHVRVQ